MKSKIKSILVSFLVVFLFFSFITLSIKADNTGSLFTFGGIDVNTLIGAKDVWQMKDAKGNPIDGTGMVVAVIDTGVDYTHPDLGGGLGQNYKVIGGYNYNGNNSDPKDIFGHGTSNAGVIASNGKVVGIAPNTKILAYANPYTLSMEVDAIDRAVKNGASAIDIMFECWNDYAGYADPSMYWNKILDSATKKGASPVCFAGNFGSTLLYPQNNSKPALSLSHCFSGAIVTGAFDVDNKNIAIYSSMGPSLDLYFKPDIIAPSGFYPVPKINNSYGGFDGTSASTHVVAGCVTLVKQAHPDWTSEEIKASLMNNATVEYNPQNNEPITWLLQGAGLVNVYKAVTTPALITPYSTLMTPDNLKPITFTIKNTSDTTQTFSISSELTLGNFVLGNTQGISVSLSDNQITLNKGETKTITAIISVDKNKLEEGPYEGLMWFDNGSTKLHVPFVIWNAPKPEEWINQFQKIFNVKTSTNILDFSNQNRSKIVFDFTIGKGSFMNRFKFGAFNKDVGWLSNYTDKVNINITDMNDNIISTIYSKTNLLLGHYKFEWNGKLPSGEFIKDGQYKYTISTIDNDTTNGKTETVTGTFEVKNSPKPPLLKVGIPDDLVITRPVTDKNSTYTFTGQTAAGCDVQVNGVPVSVDSNGDFTATVNFVSGYNPISVVASNSYGLQTSFETDVRLILQSTIQLEISSSKFNVDGNEMTLDSPPIIKNSRTLIPIRPIVEALGGTIDWNGQENKVTIMLDFDTIELWINKPTALVNGVELYIDDTNHKVVPEIINGRTMLPLRFVAENLGATVDWDQDTKTITITYTK